ncbi:MAG: Rpn family recombination-promoting nuclease/putative transposase [Planctomycetes bacterium]|nr:Rpn family recombination-promoting nuclease/putative transposase [Planctomycetota bacterium]
MTGQPHDKLVKAVFSEAPQARALLRNLLPQDLADAIDFATLKLVPGSFVDEKLTERFTDLLFSVRMGRDVALLYVLFEHQSTPDPVMPWRLLSAEARIWERWFRANPNARTLPPILPVVLYHGDRPWSAPERFSELMPEGAGRRGAFWEHVPEFRIVLIDLSRFTDAELKARLAIEPALALLVLLALRNVHAPDFQACMLEWGELFARLLDERSGLRAFEMLLHYLHEARGECVTEAGMKALCARVHASPKVEETVMNLAEKLRAEGRQEGRQQGRREGRQEGRREGLEAGARQSLVRLLRARFGELDGAALARIQAADLPTLERWLDRFVNASTLAEVLA